MRTLTSNWHEIAEHQLLSTPSLNHCIYAAGVGRSSWVGVFDADEVIVPHRYAYTYPKWLRFYERRKGAQARLAHITFRNAYFFYELDNRTKLREEAAVAKSESSSLRSLKSLPISVKSGGQSNTGMQTFWCFDERLIIKALEKLCSSRFHTFNNSSLTE